ncbi:MAG: BACON domain-containing protein [Dysgonamonadaceae bacterium]|jgi:hypothetical protein|nr:BACON domain-containing protein [Dysgonamonadaceae bacterium]
MNKLKFLAVILCMGFVFSCDKDETAPLLEVDPSQLTLNFDVGGGVKVVTVKANQAFTATSSNDRWCTTEIVPNKTEDNLKISVSANTGDERTAQITVISTGLTGIKITVNQEGVEPEAGTVADLEDNGRQVPTVAWFGISQFGFLHTEARAQELKDAGITHSLNYNFYTHDDTQTALDAAHTAGIKLITQYKTSDNPSPEEFVNKFKSHPALDGYFLADEPNMSDFAGLNTLKNNIRALDPAHYSYVNLWSNNGSAEHLGTSSYPTYVSSFISQYTPSFISFDAYPVRIDGGRRIIEPSWYLNLEQIAGAAKTANIPFWTISCSASHLVYPDPTIDDLRLQIYSSLAYGSQCIQYFTYWWTGPEYIMPPLDENGNKTAAWYALQTMNREIKRFSPVFLDAKMISVAHTGTTIPTGTTRLAALPPVIESLETPNGGAVVSVMEKGEDAYLIVVNRSVQAGTTMTLNVTLKKGVWQVTKESTKIYLGAGAKSENILPGDVVIYTWKK